MKAVAYVGAIVSVAVLSACNSKPDVDAVPVGSDVQVTRADGALVEGKLLDRDAKTVKLDVGPATATVPRDEVADIRVKTDKDAGTLPKAAKFREVSVASDAPLTIRLTTPVNSATATPETPVRGVLTKSVVVHGVTAIPAGAAVSGVVTSVESSGRVRGRALLAFAFSELTVGGAHYPIDARFSRTAAPATKKDAETIGIPAAGGAIIGAIVGGGKGAAIGAAVGGGAGTAVVLTTPGKEISLDTDTVLSLDAGRVVTVRVPLEEAGAEK